LTISLSLSLSLSACYLRCGSFSFGVEASICLQIFARYISMGRPQPMRFFPVVQIATLHCTHSSCFLNLDSSSTRIHCASTHTGSFPLASFATSTATAYRRGRLGRFPGCVAEFNFAKEKQQLLQQSIPGLSSSTRRKLRQFHNLATYLN
jgi:hypothetical protein